jgi:hypothetical protein
MAAFIILGRSERAHGAGSDSTSRQKPTMAGRHPMQKRLYIFWKGVFAFERVEYVRSTENVELFDMGSIMMLPSFPHS